MVYAENAEFNVKGNDEDLIKFFNKKCKITELEEGMTKLNLGLIKSDDGYGTGNIIMSKNGNLVLVTCAHNLIDKLSGKIK